MKTGSLVGNKYRLTKQIGEGAMGVVWAAVNEHTSRQVALKLILRSTDDLRIRLMREARACGSVSHRNIIEVLDVGQTDTGDPFLVMPLLSGETLADLLARQRRVEPSTAAQIGRDVARALAAAHAANIIHRDLKPANIFLHCEAGTEGSIVKVLDFGVSKNLSSTEALMTVVGGGVGSPAYMSPEQIRVDRDLDFRTDIWSLGVVLFEMLTGTRPFRGEPAEVIHQVLFGEIPRVSSVLWRVDEGLDNLVARCLERSRDRRVGSAAELDKLLNGYIAASATSAAALASWNVNPATQPDAYPPPVGPSAGGDSHISQAGALAETDDDGIATVPIDISKLCSPTRAPSPAVSAPPAASRPPMIDPLAIQAITEPLGKDGYAPWRTPAGAPSYAPALPVFEKASTTSAAAVVQLDSRSSDPGRRNPSQPPNVADAERLKKKKKKRNWVLWGVGAGSLMMCLVALGAWLLASPTAAPTVSGAPPLEIPRAEVPLKSADTDRAPEPEPNVTSRPSTAPAPPTSHKPSVAARTQPKKPPGPRQITPNPFEEETSRPRAAPKQAPTRRCGILIKKDCIKKPARLIFEATE